MRARSHQFLDARHGPPDPTRSESFIHLVNVKTLASERRIASSAVIRRGTPDEIEDLRQVIADFEEDSAMTTRNPHETRKRLMPDTGPEPNVDGHEYFSAPLPRDEWRYFVLSCTGGADDIASVFAASTLTRKHLVVGSKVELSPGRSIAFRNAPWFLADAQFHDAVFIDLDDADLDDLVDVHARYSKHDDGLVDLGRSIHAYRSLSGIYDRNLQLLGYVSILESLVTHQPKPSDPSDSITRQVRQKMLLLASRFRHPLSFAAFGNEKPATIWNKLYGLRSQIAHGGRPDFKGSELGVLGDMITATDFVSEATWRVMRQVLDEPRLLADLRAC